MWWKQFEDEQLNTLMEEAFRNNLDIAQAYGRLRQLEALFRITRSSQGLNITIEGSGGRSRQSGFFRGGSAQSEAFGPVTFDTYSLSAGAQYEIDIWRRLNSRTEASRLDALASEQDLKALFISISAQLADLYYLAVEQRAQLELSDQTIASFQDTLERVERRYRGGLVPALDVYQARQNLAAARAQRPLFKSRLAVTLNALSLLTGRFPEKEIGGSLTELRDAPPFKAGLSSGLLTRRPDIEAALLRLKASDEGIAAAIADRFPSFSLTGNYGGTSGEIQSVLDSPNVFWNLLLQLAQPVFDAGRRKAEVDRTDAVFMERLAAYHKTVLTAFQEVEDSLARIRASEERIRALNESVSSAESALRLSLDRYMQGLTDYLPVLTEQLRLFNAKSNLLTEKRALISNRIMLVRSLGGDWVDDVPEHYNIFKTSGEEQS
jgi:NodT family efflux transporter outer membrane factor (OMF) lipoprotein